MSIALVTDSSASLPVELAERCGVTVVPLQVVIGGTAYDEVVGPGDDTGDGATTEMVSEALRAWVPVSTSRPSPERLAASYRRLADDGASAIVSIHLSAELSGTVESAQLAARQSPVPVTVVDSRQVSMGTGFAVLAAADVRDAGGSAEEIAEMARARAAATTSLFYVDTLEYLRRGGRVGVAAALLGSALAVKPILRVEDGRIGPFEKVRTSGKALARLEELAAEAADGEVDVAVAHLASPDRAEQLASRLRERLADRLDDREVAVGEVGAALGAHVGPGMVAACVAPRL